MHRRLIHWVTAELVAIQAGLDGLNTVVYEVRPFLPKTLTQVLFSAGGVLFLLTLARMASRFVSAAPPEPDNALVRHASEIGHILPYNEKIGAACNRWPMLDHQWLPAVAAPPPPRWRL